MVSNFPGPYQLDMHYETQAGGVTLEHIAKYNVDVAGSPAPGIDFSEIEFVTKGAGLVFGAVAAQAWADLVSDLFAVSTTITYFELWSVAPESFDRTYISTLESGTAGLRAQNTSVAAQSILTFRSQEGGSMRLNFMETIYGQDVPVAQPTSIPEVDAVGSFVVSDNNWLLARDTSYPIARVRWLPGQNEKLARTRYGR